MFRVNVVHIDSRAQGCEGSFLEDPSRFSSTSCGSAGKESACDVGDLGSIQFNPGSTQVPGLVRSPGEGKGYPLQYSGLENYMDCIVHGVAKSWT